MVAQGLFLTTNVLVKFLCAKECGVEKTCDFQQTTSWSRKWYKADIWYTRHTYGLYGRWRGSPMRCFEWWHCWWPWAILTTADHPLVFYVLGLPYIVLYCSSLNLPPLNPDVTNCQSRSFFQDISHPSYSLYHSLPHPRDTSVLSRLRTATRFTRLISCSKKYCSFVNYALNNYQVAPCNN